MPAISRVISVDECKILSSARTMQEPYTFNDHALFVENNANENSSSTGFRGKFRLFLDYTAMLLNVTSHKYSQSLTHPDPLPFSLVTSCNYQHASFSNLFHDIEEGRSTSFYLSNASNSRFPINYARHEYFCREPYFCVTIVCK